MDKKIIKSKKNWFKEIKEGFKVYDFENLAKEPYNFFIIISARGQGKTYNMVSFMRQQWLNNKFKSVFAYNTIQQWITSLPRFISNHLINEPEQWEDVEVTKLGIKDKISGELFIYFVSLSGASKWKGARDASIRFMCLDEFSENLTLTRKKQVSQFESLLHTFSSPINPVGMKVFIFGNQNSINSSLLLPNLGINSLQRELIVFDKFILLWICKPVNLTFNNLNKNWLHKFSDRVELANFSFENKPLDNYENVVLDENKKEGMIRGWIKGNYIKIDHFYFQELKNDQQRFFIKLKSAPQEGVIYCCREADLDIGVVYNIDIQVYLKNLIIEKNLFFDTQFTKLIIFAIF